MKRTMMTMMAGGALMLAAAGAAEPVLRQSFETAAFFEQLSANGYTTAPLGVGGRWGMFLNREAVSLSTEYAAVGEKSVRIVRMAERQYPLVGVAAKPAAAPCEAEIWFLRGGKGAFTLVLGTVDPAEKGKMIRAVGLLCANDGRLLLLDRESGRYLPSKVTAPEESWVQLLFKVGKESCRIVATVEGEAKEIGAVPSKELAAFGLDRLEIVPSVSPAGSAVYLDEISITPTAPDTTRNTAE